MTDEELVKQKWPDAHVGEFWQSRRVGVFVPFVGKDIPVSEPCNTTEEAWQSAASRLEKDDQ